MKKVFQILLYCIACILALAILILGIIQITTEPSNTRDWNPDQAVLPFADIENNQVQIHNIRNFTYTSPSNFTPGYYDETFDLAALQRVWYVVEPFSGLKGSAHTFLSFEFENNKFVSISVEIRKEKDESFSALKGMFNTYELMYVIASETDVIKLRSNYRKDDVYLYPIATTHDKARALFLDMINRTNKLKEQPEFYNTLTNNCTTNIARHVNAVTPHKVPWFALQLVLPANSDALAYKLGLIDTTLPFEEAREYFHINSRAIEHADDPDFSIKIRSAVK